MKNTFSPLKNFLQQHYTGIQAKPSLANSSKSDNKASKDISQTEKPTDELSILSKAPGTIENDSTLKHLKNINSIDIAMETKTSVPEIAGRIAKANFLQEKYNLKPVQVFYMETLYEITLMQLNKATKPKHIKNLTELLNNIKARAKGDTSAKVPLLNQFEFILSKMVPDFNSKIPFMAQANIARRAWDMAKSAAKALGNAVVSAVRDTGVGAVRSLLSGAVDTVVNSFSGRRSLPGDDSDSYSSSSSSSSGNFWQKTANTIKRVVSDHEFSFSSKSLNELAYRLGAEVTDEIIDTGKQVGRNIASKVIGRMFSNNSADKSKALPEANYTSYEDAEEITIDMSRRSKVKERDIDSWSAYDSELDRAADELSSKISSSDKEDMAKYFKSLSEEVLKAKSLDELNISAENLITIIEMNRKDSEKLTKITKLIEDSIKKNNKNAFLKELLVKGLPLNLKYGEGNNLLHLALKHNPDLLKSLMKLNSLTVFNSLNENRLSPAHILVTNSAAKSLIPEAAAKGLNFNIRGKNQVTPLHLLSCTENEAEMEALLKVPGIDFDARDKEGNTGIITSLKFSEKLVDNSQVLAALTKVGADPNLTNQKKLAAIHILPYYNDGKLNNALFASNILNKELQFDSLTPLYIAALSQFDSEKLTEALLNSNVETKLDIYSSPLILSTIENSVKVTELLLEKGFRLSAKELEDLKEFQNSIGEDNPLIAKVIKAHGEKIPKTESAASSNTSAITKLESAGKLTRSEAQRWQNVVKIVDSGNSNLLQYYSVSNSLLDLKGEKGLNGYEMAVEAANPNLVRALAKQGLSGKLLNKVNKDGLTPLMQAATKGDLDCMLALIEVGADLNFRDSNGNSALEIFFNKHELDLVAYNKLKQLAKNDNKSNSFKDSTLIETTLRHGDLGVLIQLASEKEFDNEAFFKIAGNEKAGLAIIKHLKEINQLDLSDFRNSNGENLLHAALKSADPELTKYLIREGVGTDLITNAADSLVLAALGNIRGKALKQLEVLKESGVSLNNLRDNQGRTPLMLAAKSGDLQTVKYVLDNRLANVSDIDNSGMNAYLYAASNLKDNPEIAKALELKGINKILTNSVGADALTLAINAGNFRTVAHLIDSAALNSDQLMTKIQMVDPKKPEASKMLEAMTNKLLNKYDTKVDLVKDILQSNKLDILEVLLATKKINAYLADDNGDTLAHHAVKLNNSKALKMLLYYKVVDLKQKNYEGETSFDIAKKLNSPDILEEFSYRGYN
jgi:ankyrin repeat protein